MANALIIESDSLLAKNIAGALTREGHEAIYTPDAQAAIAIADGQTPDVIILDLMLAGRSGIEFLYEFRSYPDWRAIPVILYSNLLATELPESCQEDFGIARIFYKPTTKLSDLVAAVSAAKLLPA